MSSQLVELATNLERDSLGIWRSQNESDVSYPTSGHGDCFEVEDRSFWFQHRNRCINALIDAFPAPNGEEILDIGGGNGVVTRALEKAGHAAVLMEPGPAGALNAKHRGVSTILCSTLQDAGFPDSSVSAVGMFDVLEHIEDSLTFLGEIGQKLTPGGRLYLTVPAYSLLWSEEDVSAGHFRRYRKEEIERELALAGFKIDFSSYIFWFLPLPVLLLRSLPFRMGVSMKSSVPKKASKDHGLENSAASWLFKSMLSPEATLLRNGHRIPFGGSCMVAASLVR